MKNKASFIIILCILSLLVYASSANIVCKPKLSPEVWLLKYNAAWAICNKQIPAVNISATNYLNPDQDIYNLVSKITERTKKVEALVKKQFPDLYRYTKIPEYQKKLTEQGQYIYNTIIQNYEYENRQLEADLERQRAKNQRDLELQKEAMRRFLNNYSAPHY